MENIGTHWALQYIGKPWKSGANGPDAFNCWGLITWIYRKHFGINLPDIPIPETELKKLALAFREHEEKKNWYEVYSPTEGSLALLRRSRNPIHIGIWINANGGGILHSIEKTGVVFQKLVSMTLYGWKIESFFNFKN